MFSLDPRFAVASANLRKHPGQRAQQSDASGWFSEQFDGSPDRTFVPVCAYFRH